MDDNRKQEFRVGLFVFITIGIICAMILVFGQFGRLYRPAYSINLVFDNVGGLIVKGNVFYAGVKVGRVTAITLDTHKDRKVHVSVEVDRDVEVRRDARFSVRTSGMLGDQYIDIEPVPGSQAPVIRGGETLHGEPPVDFGAVADRLKRAIDKVDQSVLDKATLSALHDTVANAKAITDKLDRQILGQEALDHYREAIANLRDASADAKIAAGEAREFARTAHPKLDDALDRFKQIAEKTDAAASQVDKILRDNEMQLKNLIQNADLSSEKLKAILTRLEAGEGTLGQLLSDKKLHEDLKKLIENWRRYGLLYKEPKSGPGEEAPKSLDSRQGLRKSP